MIMRVSSILSETRESSQVRVEEVVVLTSRDGSIAARLHVDSMSTLGEEHPVTDLASHIAHGLH